MHKWFGMMSNGASKFSFLSLGLLAIGACGGEDVSSPALLAETTPVADAAPGSPDAEPSEPVAAGYANLANPGAVFYASFDDNGSGPGDPVSGNDMTAVWGTLQAVPLDRMYLNLYEGFGTFSNNGAVRKFSTFALPLVIDIGAVPAEQSYDTCGTCLSVLQDVTGAGDYARQLIGISGTITISELPTQAGMPLTAVISNVELREIDLWGVLVPNGVATNVTRIELTTIAAAP